MGGWNHRILVTQEGDDLWFTIHEVHYDDDGKPIAYTENGTDVSGENIESLRWVLKKMELTLEKPVLWAGERFPEEWKKPD